VRVAVTSTHDPARRAVFGAFVALGVAGGSWGARIPDVRADLDLSEGSLGTALLCLSIGAITGSWLGGTAVRRVGTRVVVAGAWVLVGAALSLPGLAGSWAALAGALLTMGVGYGLLDVSMNGAGVQLEAESNRPLLNGLHAGWSTGLLVGAGLGTLAVAAEVGPAAHLGAVGAAVAVAGLVAAPHVPDGRLAPVAPAAPGTGVGQGGRSRLVALAAIGGCIFLAEGALLDWAGVLVREDFDGGARLGVLAVTGLSAGGLAGRLVSNRLTRRWGAARLIRVGAVVAAVAFGLVLAVPSAVAAPLLLAVVGAGVAPAVPLAFAAAGHAFGERGITTVTTAGYGSYLAGPALVGGLADAANLRLALLVPLGLVVAVLALADSTTGATADTEPHLIPV